MTDTSTFPLPFQGLELPRFLLTLDQTLADLPGTRVTFVEVDALLPDDPATATIEITMHRSLVDACRAPGDPELPDEDEEYWSAELSLVDDGEETSLQVNLERNAYVMPAVVKIVEGVLQRIEPTNESEEDDDDIRDEEFGDDDDDEENDDEFEDDDDSEDDEDETDEDDEFDDDDELAEAEEDIGDSWDAVAAFERLRMMAHNTFGEAKLEGDTVFVFPVVWEDPPAKKEVRVRSFVPTVAMGQGDQASWVALECVVCPREKLDSETAAAMNAEIDFPLSLDGDHYVMSQSFALRSVDGSLFVEMAVALAEQADMLNTAIEQGILEKA